MYHYTVSLRGETFRNPAFSWTSAKELTVNEIIRKLDPFYFQTPEIYIAENAEWMLTLVGSKGTPRKDQRVITAN